MKKLLLSFLLAVLTCGMSWAETYKMTPDASTTSNNSTGFVTKEAEFTYSNIKWGMNQWNPSTLQVKTNQGTNTNEFYFYNKTALPENISKVVLTFSALTLSDKTGNASGWYLTPGTTIVGTSNLKTTGSIQGVWNSTAKTLTFTVSGDCTYFTIWQNGKVATGTNKLAESDAIVITYGDAGDDNPGEGGNEGGDTPGEGGETGGETPGTGETTVYVSGTETITADGIRMSGTHGTTTYSSPTSGLTYVFEAVKNNGIQFNSNNSAYANDGMIITANKGNVIIKSVEIEWKSNSSSKTRTINVYGSNDAYTTCAAAFGTNGNPGTLIGTKTRTTKGSDTFDFGQGYKYCAITDEQVTGNTGALTISSIKVTYVAFETITIGSTGYATMYYGDRNLTVPEGVSAWTFAASGAVLNATESYKAGDVIPAGEAVVLFTVDPKEYTFAVAATAGEKVAGNMLTGTDAATDVTSTGTAYVLGVLDNVVAFYKKTGTFNNGAHKAYLEIPAGQKAPARIDLNFGDVSGINIITIDEEEATDGAMYNSLGQKVDNNYKGLVIKNGKKFINK